jgi:hypothetical protein
VELEEKLLKTELTKPLPGGGGRDIILVIGFFKAKKIIFSFFCLLLFNGTFTSVFKDKKSYGSQVTKQ